LFANRQQGNGKRSAKDRVMTRKVFNDRFESMTALAVPRLLLAFLLLGSVPRATARADDDKKPDPIRETVAEIPDSELDALEKNLKSDSGYKWKLLEGDLKKAAELAIAAQKHNPAETELWAGLLGSIFAEEQRQAQNLPPKERTARYAGALQYLEDYSPLLQLEMRRRPADQFLRFEQDTLNGNLAVAALEAGQLTLANALAVLILEGNTNRTEWTYGNKIYDANTILGRVALRKGDRESAVKYLLESGKTPGSPQLNSIGPNFALDRELLEAGEKKAVLQHLDQVGQFWGNPNREDAAPQAIRQKMDADHARLLARWRKTIEAGRVPVDPKWK
jgi:hypothetical protein